MMDVSAGSAAVFHRYMTLFTQEQLFKFKINLGHGDAVAGFPLIEGGDFAGTPKTVAFGTEASFTYADLGGVGQFLRIVQDSVDAMKLRITTVAMYALVSLLMKKEAPKMGPLFVLS